MSEERRTLARAGELEFIRRIRPLMPSESGDIIRSVGDDCLVVRSFGADLMVMTTDTFVDEIHFTRRFFTWRETGARCMAASVSDIAAMSGLPAYSVLSLSMPPVMFLDDAVELFTGLAETAAAYGSPVTGGETTSTTGPLTVTVTVIGRVEPERVVTRTGAKAGDGIYVSGTMGDAMAGLLAFQSEEPGFDGLKRRFVAPEAKTDFSRELTRRFRISSMIDLSDGLASDLGHICEESGCGAEVREGDFPFSEEFRTMMERYGRDAGGFAVTAGEDYGLLFTSPDPELRNIREISGEPVTRIGAVTGSPGELVLIREDGRAEPIRVKGYEHFRV